LEWKRKIPYLILKKQKMGPPVVVEPPFTHLQTEVPSYTTPLRGDKPPPLIGNRQWVIHHLTIPTQSICATPVLLFLYQQYGCSLILSLQVQLKTHPSEDIIYQSPFRVWVRVTMSALIPLTSIVKASLLCRWVYR